MDVRTPGFDDLCTVCARRGLRLVVEATARVPAGVALRGGPLDPGLLDLFHRCSRAQFHDLGLHSLEALFEYDRDRRVVDPDFAPEVCTFGRIGGMAWEVAVLEGLAGTDGRCVAAWVDMYEGTVTPIAMNADALLGLYAKHLDLAVEWDRPSELRSLFPWSDAALIAADPVFVEWLRAGRFARWANTPEAAELYEAVLRAAEYPRPG